VLIWVSVANPLLGQRSTRIVSNLDDSGPGSLRDAIAIARAGDTISFGVRGIIVLTNELLIGTNLKIAGPGATNLAVSALNQSRVLEILPETAVSISGFTICDGRAPDGAAGTSNNPVGIAGGDGGGIYNSGILTIEQCVISNCAAGDGGSGYLSKSYDPDATNWVGGTGGCGGSLYNAGTLILLRCRLLSNGSGRGGDGGGVGRYGCAGSAAGSGGAIYNAGSLNLHDCILDHNIAGNGGAGYSIPFGPFDGGSPVKGGAGGNGGGLYDAGRTSTIITDCQFSFNVSGAGGIGRAYPAFSARDVGDAGGAGGGGGAIWAEGSLAMNDCTFLSNQSGPGGPGSSGIRSGGAGGIGGPGGAICAIGDLSLTRCSCASNYAGAGGDGGYSGGLAGSGGSGGSGAAVYVTSTLQLADCTFSDNSAGAGGHGGSTPNTRLYPFGPGDGGMGGSGGALCCQSYLAATNCTFNGNRAGDGGIPGYGGLNLSFTAQSSTSGSSGGQGGAIIGRGQLVLAACTVSANVGGNGSSADPPSDTALAYAVSTAQSGASPRPKFIYYERAGGPGGIGGTGGIFSENSLTMVLCTLSGNIGGAGGPGGQSWGSFMFEDGPKGGAGGSGGPGAIFSSVSNDLVLVACTIVGNNGGVGATGGGGEMRFNGQSGDGSGGEGGPGGIFHTNPAASASVINTVVALNIGGDGGGGAPPGNAGAPDLQGFFNSFGHNLIGQSDGSSGFANGVNGDLVGSHNVPIDPLLGPLADNGGPTLTVALLHGSPALDAGDEALLRPPYSLKYDQRGFRRKSGSHVDIGAFEYQFRGGRAHSPADALILSGAYSPKRLKAADEPSIYDDSNAAHSYQLTFRDSTPGATFTVLATTNLSLPLVNWSVLGQPLQIAPGLFQFTDSQATNNLQRYYRVSSP
jgi:hypothetical protein